jgi:hypothetical protein
LYFFTSETFANKTGHFGTKLGWVRRLAVGGNLWRGPVYEDVHRRRGLEFCKSESGCIAEAGKKLFGGGGWQSADLTEGREGNEEETTGRIICTIVLYFDMAVKGKSGPLSAISKFKGRRTIRQFRRIMKY